MFLGDDWSELNNFCVFSLGCWNGLTLGVLRGVGAHESAVATHEQDKSAAKIDRDEGHREGGNDSPDDEGVPLPLPDGVDEAERVVAEVLDLTAGHREAVGVKEPDTDLNEGDEEQKVQWGNDVKADLRGNLIESAGPSDEGHGEGGKAYGRIDADDDAECKAPCEATGGDAAAELAEERSQDFAAVEVVDRGRI
jgi:hypothetical protein